MMQRSRWRDRPISAVGAAGLLGAVGMALALSASSPAERTRAAGDDDVARNVIFLHGDGLSGAAREATRLATVGRDDDLVMNRLGVAGLVHTSPDDPVEPVTDSAAGATAFASGVKTFNGAVGVDVDGRPVPTVLERARDAGKATGLVTTAQVTDASPAAFAAHVTDRAEQSEIARQYLDRSRPDVILGGGEDRWLPPGEPGAYPDNPPEDPTEESRSDRGNLVERAQELGYDYVTDATELRRSRSRRLLGLFANEEMFQQRPEGQGDVYAPVVSLAQMTREALDALERDRDGFFLVVEEEAIDEMAHQNNARLTIEATRQLDRAVAVALEFAASHEDTLIVVAADHETGGLAIENATDETVPAGLSGSAEDGPFPIPGTELAFSVDWTTGEHTGADTPLTATGPGAERFAGVLENTDVHDAMVDAMRLDD